MRRHLAYAALLFAALSIRPAAGQTWDTSGNGMLNGTYYFRQVVWLVGDGTGSIGEAAVVYGNINFDGNGNYSLSNAQICDSNTCNSGSTVKAYQASGTYAVSASGYGFIANLFVSGDYVYGLVSPQGVFIGSSTDNKTGYNDLLIAAPLASPLPSNASFQGPYTMADMDFSGAGIQNTGVLYTRASSFRLNADGAGGLGNVSLSGYIAGNGTTVTTQIFPRQQYSFSGGAAVINFVGQLSAGSNLIACTKYLYFSPDGNFVFGGSPTGWDMIVGVRTGAIAPTLSGLYYQAGVYQDDSTLAATGSAAPNSRFGSVLAIPGTLIGHRRLLSIFNNNAYDYTHSDGYTANADGTYDDPYDHYTFASGGAYAVGIAKGSLLGINVLLQAPQLSGSGVYINPIGVLNAGSSAPFTASLAPGELVSLYGSNLASTTAQDGNLPTTLGGVQMMVNGRPAPLYFVSPGQINAVIPIATTESIASIQVFNNNVPSNIVTNFVGLTQPGVFNSTLAIPAIQHADYTMVTPANPVQIGETLLVYLTGLGDLTVSGNTVNPITAYIDGLQATVAFAGSQSTVGGGYQMNVTVPSGVTAGNVYLDISGPDAYNSEVIIPIGAVAASQASPLAVHRPVMKRSAPRISTKSLPPTAGRTGSRN